jgi:hypothetical protein
MSRKLKTRKPYPPPAFVVSPAADAVFYHLDSEADVVYLYDESNRTVLSEAVAETGDEAGIFWESDNYKPLAKAGLILALFNSARSREEGFTGFVYVGPPPSAQLLPKKPLNKTQRGMLHLPTGRLRIETYTGSSLGPEDAQDEGADVKVSPGSYDVTLSQAKEAKTDDPDTWPLLYDYVSLTPTAANAPPSKRRGR